MKIKMLIAMGGTGLSLAPGDVHDCDEAEAVRLIETDHAVPHDDKPIEKAVRRGPTETR